MQKVRIENAEKVPMMLIIEPIWTPYEVPPTTTVEIRGDFGAEINLIYSGDNCVSVYVDDFESYKVFIGEDELYPSLNKV